MLPSLCIKLFQDLNFRFYIETKLKQIRSEINQNLGSCFKICNGFYFFHVSFRIINRCDRKWAHLEKISDQQMSSQMLIFKSELSLEQWHHTITSHCVHIPSYLPTKRHLKNKSSRAMERTQMGDNNRKEKINSMYDICRAAPSSLAQIKN